MYKLLDINHDDLVANLDNMFPHSLFERIIKSVAFPANEDFLEIGAFEGGTTALLAKLASSLNKKLFVVDSWSGSYAAAYNKYIANTAKFSNIITTKTTSNSKLAEEIFINNKFCYVYIDGDHSYRGCKNDLDLVSKYCNSGTIVCVDDVNMKSVMDAIVDSSGFEKLDIKHPDKFYKHLMVLIKQ